MYLPPKADDRKGRRHVCSLLNTHRPFYVISINSPSLPCAMSVIAPHLRQVSFVLPFRVSILPRIKTTSSTSPTGVLGLSFCTRRIHRLLIDQSKLDSWAYLTPDPSKWDRARITGFEVPCYNRHTPTARVVQLLKGQNAGLNYGEASYDLSGRQTRAELRDLRRWFLDVCPRRQMGEKSSFHSGS